jgi:protein-disulfide isomerase
MSKTSREDRRRAELAERRARRRGEPVRRRRGLPILPLTLGAVGLGLVGLLAFAILSSPPADVDINAPERAAPAELADGMALGPASAPLTIELWSDFQCPACGAFVRQIEPLLIDEYVSPGRVRLVYRDFAFLGQESIDAAVAARCAARSGRFWQVHDYLFANQRGENQGAFNQSRLEQIASAVGLDLATFRACQDEPAVAQAVAAERSAGQAVPVNSTPTLIVGDEPMVGVPAWDDLKEVIDRHLAQSVGAG